MLNELLLPRQVLFRALDVRTRPSFSIVPRLLIRHDRLQAFLRASLDCNSMSVEKFSRWLRAVCTLLLSRNATPDRLKAIQYIEQAITVVQNHSAGDDGDEVPASFPATVLTDSRVMLGVSLGRATVAADHMLQHRH